MGHSGSIAIHISMSPSNELLFFERPHTTGGYVGQNPYLTVLPCFLDSAAALACCSQTLISLCFSSPSFLHQRHKRNVQQLA